MKLVIRKNIARLVPYRTARDEAQGKAEIWLDANENPFPTPYNRYPDPHQRLLREAIARLRRVDVANVFTANGSDEAIDLLMRVFCEPGVDNLVTISPSYGMYETAAAVNDVEVRKVLLNPDFSLNVNGILERVDTHTRLIFIGSPNNPTGNAFAPQSLCQLAASTQALVVVDEAYIDFSSQQSMVKFVDNQSNIVVVQTLSKAWGMAGLRIGIAIASSEIIGWLDRVKSPYNINSVSQCEAVQRLSAPNYEQVEILANERNRLIDNLINCTCVEKIFPSDANFLLVKFSDPDTVYARLLSGGVMVRNRSHEPLCAGCLRITVGMPAENNRVIQILKAYDE